MKPDVGDLVVVGSGRRPDPLFAVKGYTSFPGEYGYHTTERIDPGVGLVLEGRDTFYHVHVRGQSLWFEDNQLRRVEVSM